MSVAVSSSSNAPLPVALRTNYAANYESIEGLVPQDPSTVGGALEVAVDQSQRYIAQTLSMRHHLQTLKDQLKCAS